MLVCFAKSCMFSSKEFIFSVSWEKSMLKTQICELKKINRQSFQYLDIKEYHAISQISQYLMTHRYRSTGHFSQQLAKPPAEPPCTHSTAINFFSCFPWSSAKYCHPVAPNNYGFTLSISQYYFQISTKLCPSDTMEFPIITIAHVYK